MARRKRIHGRKRRKSSLKFDMKVVNGAIGGAKRKQAIRR